MGIALSNSVFGIFGESDNDADGIPEYQKRSGKSLNTDLYYEAIGIFRSVEEIEAYPKGLCE